MLQKCSEENEKWIFESTIDEGVYKCANYSSLTTSLDYETTAFPELTSQTTVMVKLRKFK